MIKKNSICDKALGLNFTATEYVAHNIELTNIHKSPFVKLIFKIFKKSPFKTKKTTPIVDKTIPNTCLEVIFFFNTKKDITKIKIGIIELIKRAFVALVVCKAIYKIVLNKEIPMIAKKDNKRKFSLRIFNIFLISRKNRIGRESKITKNHLKKANSNGSICVLTNLPNIKFPDQKSTQSTNNK